MGYVVLGDGQMQFSCRACSKQTQTRSIKRLPKGWFISGILGTAPDPESEPAPGTAETSGEALQEAASSLSDYFCSKKCGTGYLSEPEIVERVKQLAVVLVLWGQCELIVDGTPLPKEDEEINRALFGEGEEEHPDAPEPPRKSKKKKHIDEEGKERPGSPPPHKLDDGSPI